MHVQVENLNAGKSCVSGYLTIQIFRIFPLLTRIGLEVHMGPELVTSPDHPFYSSRVLHEAKAVWFEYNGRPCLGPK